MRFLGWASCVLVLITATVATDLALAQEHGRGGVANGVQRRPPMKWWKDTGIQTQLALTSQQIAAIDKVFEDAWPNQRAQWTAMREAEKEVTALMKEPDGNEFKIIAAIERAEFRRYKLNELRAITLFRMQRCLSRQQRARFEELMKMPSAESRRKQLNSR